MPTRRRFADDQVRDIRQPPHLMEYMERHSHLDLCA